MIQPKPDTFFIEKVFSQPKGDFIIRFANESQFKAYSGLNPISIIFSPTLLMLHYEALKYANEFSELIVKEARVIFSRGISI